MRENGSSRVEKKDERKDVEREREKEKKKKEKKKKKNSIFFFQAEDGIRDISV